jgi:hypothetical protein
MGLGELFWIVCVPTILAISCGLVGLLAIIAIRMPIWRRTQQLSAALAPLKPANNLLSIAGPLITTYGHYQGLLKDRPAYAQFDQYSMIISLKGAFNTSVTIERSTPPDPITSTTAPQSAIPETSDAVLNQLVFQAEDHDWVDTLLSDPIARAAALRLTAPQAHTIQKIYFSKNNVAINVYWRILLPRSEGQSSRSNYFIADLNLEAIKDWFRDLELLAKIAELLPPAHIPQPSSPISAQTLTDPIVNNRLNQIAAGITIAIILLIGISICAQGCIYVAALILFLPFFSGSV